MQKRFLPMLIVAGILLAGGGVYACTHHFASRYLTTQQSEALSSQPVSCQRQGATHYIIIEHNAMQPQHTQAALCDKLTITNKDRKQRIIAFGRHEHHVAYDGITEKPLESGQSFTITFNQIGSFIFHDHLQDETQGSFTVVNQR